MVFLLKQAFRFGPLIFAFGFLAPLIAQIVANSGLELPAGITPLTFGLTLAILLGVAAQLRGRWI